MVHAIKNNTGNAKNNNFFFNYVPTPEQHAEVLAQELKRRNIKNVSTVINNHKGSILSINEFKNFAIKYGINIIEEEIVNIDNIDFSLLVAKMKDKNPEIYITTLFPPSLDRWKTALIRQNVLTPITGMDTLDYSTNKEMFEYAGAAGGFVDKYGYPFCRGRVFDTTEKDNGQYDGEAKDIFWATGAALMVERESYLTVGGLDTDFFAHMEEIDLCWRLHLLGKRIAVVPQSTVYHLGGGTLAAGNPRKTYLNFRNNLFMLYKNLPLKEGKKLIFKRKLLDGVAACLFLVKGSIGEVKSVWRAHRDFEKGKSRYKNQPTQNILKLFPESNRSIVFDYYLKGKHKF